MTNTAREPEFTVSQPTTDASVIAVNTDLDMITSPTLTQLLAQERTTRTQLTVVDLSRCDFMGSSGLASLVQAQSELTQAGGRLAIAGCNRTVSRAITATGLDTVLDIYPTVHDALTVRHQP